MLSKASLKKKLLLAFAAVSAFVIGVAVMGYTQMNKVQKEYGYISEILVDNIQKVSFLNDAGHEAHRLLFRSFSTLMDKDHKDYLTVKERFQEQVNRMETLNKEYRSTPFTGKEEALYEEVWKGWLSYKEAASRFFEKADQTFATNSSPDEAKKILDNELRTMRMNTRKPFEALMSYQDELSREKGNLAQEAFAAATILSTVFSVIGVIFAMSIGFYFSTTISKTISNISENILSSSTQTAAASEQLTSASSQLSQGATESAASLEETVSSLEELSSMVKLNSDHAKEANSLSQRSLQSAEQGEREINKLIVAMGDMSKSSKKIEEIINVIDDIAFQTNLLALNAAVEAARAGEQGKGFAVVADAVRNLAGRSAVAAKDINVLIKENVGKTVEGVQIADTSGASLKEILTSVKKVADLNSEISAASQEQASGIEQISKAMNHLDSAIQSNASSSEEVASSAAEMSSQAECLSELVIDMKKFIEGKSVTLPQSPNKTNEAKPKVTKNFSSPKQRAEIFPLDESESKIGKAEGF